MEEQVNVINEKPTVSYFWKGLALFMLGMVLGFLVAPIKNGVSMFNNNGNENKFDSNSAEFNGGCDED